MKSRTSQQVRKRRREGGEKSKAAMANVKQEQVRGRRLWT